MGYFKRKTLTRVEWCDWFFKYLFRDEILNTHTNTYLYI